MSTSFQVTFDAADPARLATFWAVALGYVRQPPPEGFDTWDAFLDSVGVPADQRDRADALVDPEGVGPRLFFQKVPEGKTSKNRVHLDVNIGAPDHDWAKVEAHVHTLEEAGGTMVEERQEMGSRWVVMTDPEGNELCVQ
jgi:hypothetical protein